MAPNYANLFMATLEKKMIEEFHHNTGKKPLCWFRYIDDIFFIWTHDNESLQTFIRFCNNYTKNHSMRSEIKFETNISRETVNFLDVKVNLQEDKISTTLYSKPTDAHHLNVISCHPNHTIKHIPKGQFIRIRRILSTDLEYLKHAKQLV